MNKNKRKQKANKSEQTNTRKQTAGKCFRFLDLLVLSLCCNPLLILRFHLSILLFGLFFLFVCPHLVRLFPAFVSLLFRLGFHLHFFVCLCFLFLFLDFFSFVSCLCLPFCYFLFCFLFFHLRVFRFLFCFFAGFVFVCLCFFICSFFACWNCFCCCCFC